MTRTNTSPASLMSSLVWHLWLPVLIVVVLIVVTAGSTEFYFPAASQVFADTWQIWVVGGGFTTDVIPSLTRLVTGFAIAVVIGVVLGVILGVAVPVEDAARPLIEVIRSVPGVALLPLAMMFLGPGETMKVVLISFTAMWPILLNTIDGVRRIDPAQRAVMRSFNIRTMDRFRFVYLPTALPQVFAGARISLAIAVAVMVAVEMFGTPGGIGYFIRHAQQTFKVTDMWTGMLVLGIFGYVLNIVFRLVEARVLRWHTRMNKQMQGES